MSVSPLSVLGSSTRSLEWLGGPAALLSSTALTTNQLSGLGPIASLVEGVAGTPSSDTDSTLPDVVTAPANQAVLQTHAQIEDVGHQVTPLNNPLHALTALGETVGLGHLGEGGNLLTDSGGVVANPTDPASTLPLFGDSAQAATAAGTLVDTVVAAPAAGNGLVGSGTVLAPAEGTLNQAVLGFHASLEDTGHQVPLVNNPIHGVTGLGETIGLGHLGETGTLLTDASTVPGSILNGGGLASASPVLTDLGHTLGAVDTLVGSIAELSDSGKLLSSGGTLAPVTSLANAGAMELTSTLTMVGQGVAPLGDAIHGLTNLGDAVGLGHLGDGGNLVTDAAALPSHILGGGGIGSVAPVLTDAGSAVSAISGLLDGATGSAGGLGGGLTPVTTTVGGLLDNAGGVGTGGLLGGLTGSGGGDTHPAVQAGAGPTTDTPVANVGILAPEGGSGQAVQVDAGSAPAGQPSLLHAALLTGDSLIFPQTGNGGDALVGHLQSLASTSAVLPADAGSLHDLTGDLGLSGIDLTGHAQVTPGDPTPHGATTGLHLLGL